MAQLESFAAKTALYLEAIRPRLLLDLFTDALSSLYHIQAGMLRISDGMILRLGSCIGIAYCGGETPALEFSLLGDGLNLVTLTNRVEEYPGQGIY